MSVTERGATESSDREDADGYRAVVVRLAAAQKHSVGAPAYSRFVNRPLGRRIAAAAYLLNLTPNAVTGISAAFSFAGIAVLALVEPALWVGVLVSGLLVVGYALDAADGQLARLRGGGSHAGEWLDHMVDATKISALHLAVLVAGFRFFDFASVLWLLIPILFTVVANTMFFGMILNDLLRARVTAKTNRPVVRNPPSTLRSLLVIPTDYGVLCLVFLLLGAPTVFFAAYTFLFAGSAGFMLLAAIKWFRDMAALDDLVGRR